tara:strand:- start:55 stop:303 length:249 start_codon:yes stop_codon:yes gene_type:complete
MDKKTSLFSTYHVFIMILLTFLINEGVLSIGGRCPGAFYLRLLSNRNIQGVSTRRVKTIAQAFCGRAQYILKLIGKNQGQVT